MGPIPSSARHDPSRRQGANSAWGHRQYCYYYPPLAAQRLTSGVLRRCCNPAQIPPVWPGLALPLPPVCGQSADHPPADRGQEPQHRRGANCPRLSLPPPLLDSSPLPQSQCNQSGTLSGLFFFHYPMARGLALLGIVWPCFSSALAWLYVKIFCVLVVIFSSFVLIMPISML